MMLHLLQTAQDILVKGKIDSPQLERLRRHLYADGGIDRKKVNVLVGLHQRIPLPTPAFQCLFYKAVKDYLLARDQLGAEETEWLLQALCADGAFKDEERTLLRELKDEARKCSPEFEDLFRQGMVQAPEQRTCC